MSPRIWLLCGRGGVGKTTLSAALAWALADHGRAVALLTVDPAQRLADALGLPLGNAWTRLPHDGPGTIDAAMLDRRAAWEALVREELGDRAEALLDHPVGIAVGTRLGGSYEYLALERLERTAADGRWTDIVVDTPPAQHALDLLRGPARLRRAFDPAVLAGLRATGGLTRRGLGALGRIAGSGLWEDIASFFALAEALGPVLRAHGDAAAARLRAPTCAAWWVARVDNEDLNGLDTFRTALADVGVVARAVVANRVATAPGAATVSVPDPPALTREAGGPAWCASVRQALAAEAHRATGHDHVARRLAAVSGLPVHRVPDTDAEGLHGIATLAAALHAAVQAR